MSGWSLQLEGVQSVLTEVNAEANAMSTDLVGTAEAPVDHGSDILAGLTWGGGITSGVVNAVNDAMTSQVSNITSIANRINAGQVGVLNAALAYRNGDEEMASTFQRAAASAAESGDFTYFEEHGVQ